jgi:hypothetical protein
MPQIIQEEPGFGYRLGTGLGAGLSSTLQNLTNLKLNELASRNQQALLDNQRMQTSGLLQQFGLSPEVSQYVATLPPKEQWAAVQELSGLGALNGLAPQPEAIQAPAQQPAPQETTRPLSAVLADMNQQQPRSVMDLLSLPRQQNIPEAVAPQVAPQQVAPQQAAPAQGPQQPTVQPQAQQQAKPAAPVPLTRKEINKPITPAEKLALKRQLDTEKEAAKIMNLNQKEINKETQDYYKGIIKENEAAKKSDLRLGRLEQLVKRGNLPNATWYRLFKDLSEEGLGVNSTLAGAALGTLIGGGIGSALGPTGTLTGSIAGRAAIGGLIGSVINPLVRGIGSAGLAAQRAGSPDVEEFEKLSNDFIREAREIFGARVTDQDLRAFMQIIPTLMQTDAGKNRIIENMRAFNQANHVRYNAMKQIIEANGGKRPANLEFLVDEFTQPQLEKLADQFKQGIVTTTALPPKQTVTRATKSNPRKQIGVIASARQRAGLQ